MAQTTENFKRILLSDGTRAALILIVVLHLCFAPCIWGTKTLLESAREVPSILPQGAWDGPLAKPLFSNVLDPGAAGWQSEPLLALLRYQYLNERTLPFWNPYQAYGKPLAANMLSQPFFPLTAAFATVLTPKTYSWYILLRLFLAGISTYFYLRFFVSFTAAVAGGVTTLLSGYYMLSITMFYLSVETLLPLALLAAEYLLRKPTFLRLSFFAVVLLLVQLGGMPESALILLTFLYLYLAYRTISDSKLRSNSRQITTSLVLSTVAGVLLSAFLLLPFWEFVQISFNTHQAANVGGNISGLTHELLGPAIFTYLFPLLLGPPQGKSGWSGIRDYIGLLSFCLMIVAVASVRRRGKTGIRVLSSLTIFYFATVLFIVLRRYGFAGLNWLGSLPLYSLIDFPKYDEAVLSIAASVLCAIGVERLVSSKVSLKVQMGAWIIASLIIPAALVLCRQRVHALVAADPSIKYMSIGAITIPAALLFLLAIVLILFRMRPHPAEEMRGRPWLGIFVVCLLTAEMSLNYVAPMYYRASRLPSATSNPYAGAPFIDALKKYTGTYRIFAKESVLFPEWSSALQLQDIRDLDALYYRKYLPFVRNFFRWFAFKPGSVGPDLQDRFNGTASYDFTDPLERRLLQLSSAKFIVTETPYGVMNHLVDQVFEENRNHLTPGRENLITKTSFLLGGVVREGLGEHPPYERLPYRVRVGENESIFHFAYGINPVVFDKSGDGVGFTIEVEDAAGNISKLFYAYIDPKHNATERRWMEGQVNLSRYRGQTIQLLFSTDPGPNGDSSYDWASWSDFGFDTQSENEQRLKSFKPIYRGEAWVYEYDAVLPRAAVYFHADVVKGDTEALSKLRDPGFDVFRSVVLDATKLNQPQEKRIAEMDGLPSEPAQPATVTNYRSQEVEIEAVLPRQGILVLNDSDYPGWSVQVDGRSSKWVSANYMFRGVFLDSGKHAIRFVYRPKSFYQGAAVSGATAILLMLFGFASSGVMHKKSAPVRAS